MNISPASIIILVISLVNFLLGGIGLILNVFVFTRPIFRQEPCVMYFISATYFNLFIIFIVIPVRISVNAFNVGLSLINLGICKIEYFIFNSSRSISCLLIAFACIDRYFHSSANARIRQFSSIRIARRTVGVICILMFIAYSHMLVFYHIEYTYDSQNKTVSQCTSTDNIYNNFFGLFHMIFYSLCPSFIMICFGLLTISNIRNHRRILPSIINESNRILRRRNNQLLRMLTVQVLAIIIFTLPYSIMKIYLELTNDIQKDTFRLNQEAIASSVVMTIPYFAHSSSFYLYTLTGTVFRKELRKMFSSHR